MVDVKVFILAGGKGTRLWPLSRENFPKQFINFLGEHSLYEETLLRAMKITSPENIFVITSKIYEDLIKGCTVSVNETIVSNIIIEPEGKNTLPATMLGCYKLKKNDVFLVMPSDHLILDEDNFLEDVKLAVSLAKKGNFVTFGIMPAKPETGFGYIETVKGKKNTRYLSVINFVEKPDIKTATTYLRKGSFYWNSGIFVFDYQNFIKAVKEFETEIYKYYSKGVKNFLSNYGYLKPQSLDYGVMERIDKKSVLMIPASFRWSDLGSFDAIYEALADESGDSNVVIGRKDVLSLDSKNNLLYNDEKLLVTIGVDNIIFVNTEDAVLIMKKGMSEKLKEINKILNENSIKELNYNKTGYRPWGSYTVILEGERYKIKKIKVNPSASLSLQMHYHRSEHWVVIKGTAKVVLDGKEVFVHENESIYIPKSTLHRLENPGKVVLEIIEVQNGEYLNEDDIVRFNDVYGRVK